MSLRWYELPRLVVLSLSNSALEAARAIESNNIGAVVVQDQGRVAGIVTDRDLTVRVVGRGLDPTTTLLADVMTSPVATLGLHDSQSNALRLMQERGIRRIPLLRAERLVGIVTLDDLLLDEAAPLEEVALVVQAQLGAGGPAAIRSTAARRRDARAQTTYGRLINQVWADTGLETPEEAEIALEVVLGTIVRRLMPGEAKDLIAQLPSLLQPALRALPPGPDKLITGETLETELRQRLNVDSDRAAQLVNVVGTAISEAVSPGQIQDVQGQLPANLRHLLAGSVPAGA